MSIAFGMAVYFVIWWIVLLLTLPFGVRNIAETGEQGVQGQDRGAPSMPRLKQKLVWTTGITTLIFLIFLANRHYGWLTLEMLPGPDRLY